MNQNKNTTPDELMSLMSKRLNMLASIIKSAEKDLRNSPEGSLRMLKNHGSKQYYHCCPGCNHGEYIRRSDEKLPRKIAQRDYAELTIEAAQKECRVLTDYIEHYDPDLSSFVDEKLPLYKQELVKPYIESDHDYIARWLGIKEKIKSENNAQMLEKYPIETGSKGIVTERGEFVRSKSEKILADKLFLMRIPYSYECPLYVKNLGYLYPDFTLLNTRTRNEYYWEHLGMMSKDDYCEKAIQKIETYEQNNIYPGSGLILTYEAENHAFNSSLLEGMIREYLI
jgi:hypothetical protein